MEQLQAEHMVSVAAKTTEETPKSGEMLYVEHYLARLENEEIAIYMVNEKEVKFLYRLEVYTGNYPAEEVLRLKRGVILKDRKELAAFEEDYTS